MSQITENFEKIVKERKIDFEHQEHRYPTKNTEGKKVEEVQQFYQTTLKISATEGVPCAIVIHDASMEQVNYQITYNRIGQVTDRHKLPAILEKLNELNSLKTGYYHFVISDSGELSMRHLGMTGVDTRPLVDTFVAGGSILNLLLPDLTKLDGLKIGGQTRYQK